MPLQDIIEKIYEEKDKKKKELENDSKKEIFLVEKKHKEKKEKKKDNILTGVEERTGKKVAEAAWKAIEKRKITVLKKKRELIEKVYKDAFMEISRLTEEEHSEFIRRSLKKAAKELKNFKIHEAEIIPAPRSKKFAEEIIKEEDVFKIGDDVVDSVAGFILKTEKNDIDFRLENIFKRAREDTEIKVMNSLFGKK